MIDSEGFNLEYLHVDVNGNVSNGLRLKTQMLKVAVILSVVVYQLEIQIIYLSI